MKDQINILVEENEALEKELFPELFPSDKVDTDLTKKGEDKDVA